MKLLNKKYTVFIPTYDRLGMLYQSVRSVRRFNKEVDIFCTVEKSQYKEYKHILGNYVYFIPLQREHMGAGYAIYFGLNFLKKLGYRYVLRIDDDVRIQFSIDIMYKCMKANKEFAWIGAWPGIFDLFFQKKQHCKITEDGLYSDKNMLTVIMCYMIDLKKLWKVGGWEWRMTHMEDLDVSIRFLINGYKIGTYSPARMTAMARVLEDGKGGIGSHWKSDGDIKMKRKNELKNAKLLRAKYGKNIKLLGFRDDGRIRLDMKGVFERKEYELNKRWTKIPYKFLSETELKKYMKFVFKNRKKQWNYDELNKTDSGYVNDKLRSAGLWVTGRGKLPLDDRMRMLIKNKVKM